MIKPAHKAVVTLGSLLVAGAMGMASTGSAQAAVADGSCLLANPPVSMTADLSEYDQKVRNDNITNCQNASEHKEMAMQIGAQTDHQTPGDVADNDDETQDL